MRTLFIFLVLVFPVCLHAQVTKDTSFTIFSDAKKITKLFPGATVYSSANPELLNRTTVTYKKDTRGLAMDIFVPKSAGKRIPAIIMLHGGGWRSGNRFMENQMAASLAEAGYVTVTVEYRLSPEAVYPAALEDVKDACHYIFTNAKRYNIDNSRIALYGCSSGGHLAVLSGICINTSAANSSSAAKIKAVIDIDGVLDLTDPAESGKDSIPEKPSAARQWLGYTYSEKPELWKSASPINLIDANSPPVLFINSSIPRFHAGRDSVISLLNSHGIASQVYTLENTPHTFWLYNPWAPLVLQRIIQYLNAVFPQGK